MPTPGRSRFDVDLPVLVSPSRSGHPANSSLRFFAVEGDGCGPACGDCEIPWKPRLISSFSRRPSVPGWQLGERSKHQGVGNRVSGRRNSRQRLTCHAGLHQSLRRPLQVMRRGILLSNRRSATCMTDSAALPVQARIEPPAALMGFSLPLAGLVSRNRWIARFRAVRARVSKREFRLNRPFSPV